MKYTDRMIGFYAGFGLLNLAWGLSYPLGLHDSEFKALYLGAYLVLHAVNFFTDGLGVGVLINRWLNEKREARQIRKMQKIRAGEATDLDDA